MSKRSGPASGTSFRDTFMAHQFVVGGVLYTRAQRLEELKAQGASAAFIDYQVFGPPSERGAEAVCEGWYIGVYDSPGKWRDAGGNVWEW